MSRNVLAVYPGTFDPVTRGHEDLIGRAAELFDGVIVAVSTAYHKKTLFSLDERLALLRESVKDLPGVSVEPFTGLVRDFVRAHGARAMVRGVRGVTDFDYELQLAGMNRNLMPDVETVFLAPSARYQFVSSTFVREIGLLGDGVEPFVSPHVLAQLIAKRDDGRKP